MRIRHCCNAEIGTAGKRGASKHMACIASVLRLRDTALSKDEAGGSCHTFASPRDCPSTRSVLWLVCNESAAWRLRRLHHLSQRQGMACPTRAGLGLSQASIKPGRGSCGPCRRRCDHASSVRFASMAEARDMATGSRLPRRAAWARL